ncbi:MFS transporter, partial [bacterium]
MATVGGTKTRAVWRRGPVLRVLVIALLAEIGYAALNLSTMAPYLEEDRRFGATVISLVITAFLLSEAVFKAPMGAIADRLGPRKLMTLGPAISVFSALGTLLIPHNIGALEVVAFVLLRVLDGLAVAMLWPAAFAQMNASVDDEDRQGAMSLLNLCYMVGIALAFPIGGLVNDLSHTTWAGLILAAVLFGATSMASFLLLPHRIK